MTMVDRPGVAADITIAVMKPRGHGSLGFVLFS
jgi:hypothetical protein